MSRVFSGALSPGSPRSPHPLLSPTRRPFIRVGILIGRARASHSFMIDTGSDYTVVQREVIIPQLDAEGMELSEEDAGNQIVLHGIGPTPLTC